jgi:teichuronic acid biosynthesis glycosyltransferase TuaC
MRIALITPILPMSFDPTRGRFIYETARALSKMADVRVYLQHARYPALSMLRPRTYVYGKLDTGYQVDGLEVEAFDYPALPVLSRGLNGHVAGHMLTQRLKRFHPDLVLGYWVYPDAYAGLRAARELKLPCVVGALGSDIHLRTGISHKMTGLTLRSAEAVITVSEAMRQFTLREFGARPDKVHTIVNGFNTSVFHIQDQAQVRARLSLQADMRAIIYVGRFIEAKGLFELMEAFRQLAAADPKLRLVLVGNGVLDTVLRNKASELQLADRVIFTGGLQPSEVCDWIGASDVLTLPSWSEGYPNVVVEGVACGRPVVATDVGGTREILHEHNGILIPPRQAATLAQALREALDRTWDHAAIAAAMARSWDDVAQETLSVCEQVKVRHTP